MPHGAASEVWVYVGAYAPSPHDGIYICRFDARTGRLEIHGSAGGTDHPSFLAVDPANDRLYAVNEIGEFQGEPAGYVAAFAIGPGGGLRLLGKRSSKGRSPCYIEAARGGSCVLVANYMGGNVAVLPAAEEAGLGEAASVAFHRGSGARPDRQEGPHPHAAVADPFGRFVLAPDLGADEVRIYRLTDSLRLVPHDPPGARLPAGSGPRHLAFHPSGRFAYLVCELDSTVTVFHWLAEEGRLDPFQTVSTLPGGARPEENAAADIHAHPSGRFLYASNRGRDSLAVYRIDGEDGRLEFLGHVSSGGRTPRNFAIDPAGRFLLAANQDSRDIAVFRVDPERGELTPAGDPVSMPHPPACVRFGGPVGAGEAGGR